MKNNMKNSYLAGAVLTLKSSFNSPHWMRSLRNAALAAGALLAAQAQAQTYDFYYLGSLGSARPFIFNTPTLNNMGQAAGTSSVSGVLRPTVWNGAAPSYLPVPPGGLAGAVGINDSGVVAGSISPPSSGGTAAIWSGGSYTLLPSLGGYSAWSSAINNAGQVAGVSYLPSGVVHAVLWNAGVATDLGALPGTNSSMASAINNAGVVAGLSDSSSSGGSIAVTWTGGAGPVALPSSAYLLSQAYAINDSGLVAGSGMELSTNIYRALLWNGGSAPLVLPGLGGHSTDNAYGINNAGDVVGMSALVSGPTTRAVLWPAGVGTVVDLNGTVANVNLTALGYVLTEADDINELGWITGRLRNLNTGLMDMFLLIPVPPAVRR